MILTLLATVQLLSTWASSLSSLDHTVNQEIAKLEASVDQQTQQLEVKDIKIEMARNYYAFIVYEIKDIDQK